MRFSKNCGLITLRYLANFYLCFKLNDNIDKQHLNHKVSLETTKSRSNQLQTQLDDAIMNLDSERNNQKAFQLKVNTYNFNQLITNFYLILFKKKIENYERQEAIHANMIDSLKLRVNELEVQLNDSVLKDANYLNELRLANTRVFKIYIELT